MAGVIERLEFCHLYINYYLFNVSVSVIFNGPLYPSLAILTSITEKLSVTGREKILVLMFSAEFMTNITNICLNHLGLIRRENLYLRQDGAPAHNYVGRRSFW